tara:strand:- start:640 stop:1119 length:480 start_codon:yes stop_codon:yes gene_type:complete
MVMLSSKTRKNIRCKRRRSKSKKTGGGISFSKPNSKAKENTNNKLETKTRRKQVLFREEPVSNTWSQSPRNSDEFYVYDKSGTKTLRDALRDEAVEKKVKEKYIDKYIDLQLSERRAKQKQNKTNRKKIIRDTKLYYMQRKEQQDKQRIMDEMIRNYHR